VGAHSGIIRESVVLIGALIVVFYSIYIKLDYSIRRHMWRHEQYPWLRVAIDATDSEDCAAGYGAAYPVALFCMVIFTTMIVKTVN
jgi:uncharacterized transporter YbjL